MKSEEFHDAEDGEWLFEMSNIRKATSGLPVNIYISSEGAVAGRHGPRLKIMTNTGDKFQPYQTVSVLLKKDIASDDVIGYHQLDSKIINAVRDYVNLNYDALMAHWNGELDSAEVLSQLKPLPNKGK